MDDKQKQALINILIARPTDELETMSNILIEILAERKKNLIMGFKKQISTSDNIRNDANDKNIYTN